MLLPRQISKAFHEQDSALRPLAVVITERLHKEFYPDNPEDWAEDRKATVPTYFRIPDHRFHVLFPDAPEGWKVVDFQEGESTARREWEGRQ